MIITEVMLNLDHLVWNKQYMEVILNLDHLI